MAYDTIMVFPDRFRNHLLADQLHILNVCFLTPEMRREYGGTAGNIAYNLKLLDDDPLLMATVGQDIAPYLERLKRLGIGAGALKHISGQFTAQAFITTDLDNNQIIAFHPGAMNHSHENRITPELGATLAIVGPDGKEGMQQHSRQCAAHGIPLVFDPGQGMPMFSGDELMEMVKLSSYLAVNDYEGKMLEEKTGRKLEDLARGLKALRAVVPPLAVEAESGGGRISLWLTVDHPDLVERLVLSSVASETPPDSPMTERMAQWLDLAERGEWADFFAQLAAQLKPARSVPAQAAPVSTGFQPTPSTPERFIGELRATLDPTSFVTDRLGEIRVPTLVLAGGRDQVVPLASTRLVAERIPDARLEVDPEGGHTVRASFRGYDELVEAFLAEGDPAQP